MPNENNATITALAVKALDDWVLDVLAAPFGSQDSDGQTFDNNTDFMLSHFAQPAILYHHGILPGAQEIQKNPVVIGKAQGVEIKSDGVHVRVILDKASEYARRVWEAAKQGQAVASSDSITHLARLDIGGKSIMYEKSRAGRIAVWPLAGLSLWDKTEGNFRPASRLAIALPAMKAIYRDAGLPFPELDTHGVSDAAKARRAEIIEKSKLILKRTARFED